MIRSVRIALLASFLAAPTYAGQEAPAIEPIAKHKVAVYIDFKGEDEVGRGLVYSLREEIRKSAGYQLADTRDDAGVSVSILSIAIGEGETYQSAIGVTMAALPGSHNRFLGSEIRIVGEKMTDTIAHSIAITIDQLVTSLRRRFVENQEAR
ncbi:MAG: hypothetical protein ACRD1T_19020 [Acidimicrobiia bacterium]